LSPLAAVVLSSLAQTSRSPLYRLPVYAVLGLALIMHIHAAPWRRFASDYRPLAALCREIGESVNHSDKTLWLAADYGKPLQYHGEIAGANWPWRGDMGRQRMRGLPPMTAEQRLDRLLGRTSAEFFIVMEAGEFAAQRDLQDLLASRYAVLKQTPQYLVYDLRRPLNRSSP
jgi:hypothetical protein